MKSTAVKLRAYSWTAVVAALVFYALVRGLWLLVPIIQAQGNLYVLRHVAPYALALLNVAFVCASCVATAASTAVCRYTRIPAGTGVTLLLAAVQLAMLLFALPGPAFSDLGAGYGWGTTLLRVAAVSVGVATGRLATAAESSLAAPLSLSITSVLLFLLPLVFLRAIPADTGNPYPVEEAMSAADRGVLLSLAVSVAAGAALASGTCLARGAVGVPPLLLSSLGSILPVALLWSTALVMGTGLPTQWLIIPAMVTGAAIGGLAPLLLTPLRRRAFGRTRPYAGMYG